MAKAEMTVHVADLPKVKEYVRQLEDAVLNRPRTRRRSPIQTAPCFPSPSGRSVTGASATATTTASCRSRRGCAAVRTDQPPAKADGSVLPVRLVPTDIPGLWDVEMSDGTVRTDLTQGQVRSLTDVVNQ